MMVYRVHSVAGVFDQDAFALTSKEGSLERR